MKFTCETKPFSKACQTVSRAAATKASIPAIEGIKIEVKGETAYLCGYNLELGITTEVESRGECGDGAIVLGAKTLCGITKKLPGDFTEISVDEVHNSVEIKSGESAFQIMGIPASEFPEMPKISAEHSVSIKQSVMKQMIRQTIFAVADANSSRPLFTGALFKVESGSLTTVGVDGYRLAKCQQPISYSGESFDAVIPRAALAEVSGLLADDGDSEAALSVDSRHAIFIVNGYTIFSRLLEGEFLDYDTVIPRGYKTEALVDVEEMLQSVERVALVSSDRLHSPLRMAVSGTEGDHQISLDCNTAIGKAHDALKAEINGDSITIGFNDKYLSDALKNADCDEVKLQFSGPLNPMVILPDGGDSFVYLVLPVRLAAAL